MTDTDRRQVGSTTPGYHVAAIPGDGIGPEVLAAGRRVLDATAARFGFALDWQELTVGGAAIDAYGVPIREGDLDVCRQADAVYLGAVGGPRWDDPSAAVRPEQALFALRGSLELFANLRPVVVEPALVDASTLRPEVLVGVDLLIVRELTGGIYFGRPSEERHTPEGRVAVDTLWYTEHEIRRVARLAFDLARGRRRRLTSVDKANVLASSRLWRKVVDEVAPEFPDVRVDHRLVDAAAMMLIRDPGSFDVLVTENLFGDILSDEAAMLTGSLGMLPSASLGSRRTAHGLHGLYEPIHGSAPDIAGQDTANPIAAILSGAMLLRWSLGRTEAAEAVESAVRSALREGLRTTDLARVGAGERAVRVLGTMAFTDEVVARVVGPGRGGETATARQAAPVGLAADVDGDAADLEADVATMAATDTLLGLP
ncbi:MAG TPA: 3-isopropylmalate dehydrogenase [Candidatus Acidoferrales bacterium]|nr:3-isopropylmalate dehydrogenase [Candidatus Acidoferrales bacterium]